MSKVEEEKQELQSGFALIDGFLRKIKDPSSIGTVYIAVEAVGEQGAKSAKGYRPLRGILLTKTAVSTLTPLLGDDVTEGDLIEVTVVSDDLQEDLRDGKGLLGNPPFKGVAVRPIATQRNAKPAEKRM